MRKINIIGNVINELYRCFEILNTDYFEGKLPAPMITIQKQRPNNLGHFTLGKVWKSQKEIDNDEISKYEININPVNLNRPVEEIVHTLQHEMVHYINTVNGVKDCNGQIHNKKFKEAAEKVGLFCEKSKQYGWGFTHSTEEFKEYVSDKIKPNSEVFEYFRVPGIPKEKKPINKSTFKYICPECELVVKAKPDKHIKCADCDRLMEMEE